MTPHIRQMPKADGYRLLRLTVKPGEKLSFKLKSENDKVSLHAFIPTPPPQSLEWRTALKQANFPAPQGRNHLVIQNTTKEPQELILMIIGLHGYNYRVELERS